MICGTLDNWNRYVTGEVWEKAFAYLKSLTPDSPNGKTFLQADDLFGIVMSYKTRACEEAITETHCKYIDIQVVLAETEGIDWFPRDLLTVKTPYDAESDAAFYERPAGNAPAHIELSPGRFLIFYPEDAHMCQLMVGGAPREIKKAVVKVRLDLVADMS
jgi:biofilm protein TabA